MAQRRKYKFNWIDHLYYIGKGGCPVPSRWPMPFETLLFSILMWPIAFSIIYWPSDGVPIIICMTLYIFIVLFYDWLLRKYRYSPERERAYFRRYPQQKEHSVIVLFWLPITMLLGNIAILGFVVYLFR